MFSTAIPITLYVLSFILLTLPVVALLLLWRKYKIPFLRFFVSGIAGYFLIISLLVPLLMSVITSLLSGGAGSEQYWSGDRYNAFLLLYSGLTAILQPALLFVVLRYILRGNFRIYDCMAMGVAFWYYPCMTTALSNVSYARVILAYNKGELASMATEATPLATLETSVQYVADHGLFIFIAQTINQLFMILASVVVMVLLYHAIKSHKLQFLLYAVLTVFAYLCIINFSERLWGQTSTLICLIVMAAACILFLVLYFRWYRGQQLELLRQRQEYKERLKNSGK